MIAQSFWQPEITSVLLELLLPVLCICLFVSILLVAASIDVWRSDEFQRRSKLHIGRWNIAFSFPYLAPHRKARLFYQGVHKGLYDLLIEMQEVQQDISRLLSNNEMLSRSHGNAINNMMDELPPAVSRALIVPSEKTKEAMLLISRLSPILIQSIEAETNQARTVLTSPLPDRAGTAFYVAQVNLEAIAVFRAYNAVKNVSDIIEDLVYVWQGSYKAFAEEFEKQRKKAEKTGDNWQEIEKIATRYKEIGHKFDNQETFAQHLNISAATLSRALKMFEDVTGEQIRPGRGRKKGGVLRK